MEPVVELCSAKLACKQLQRGTVGWITLVKYSDSAQANCPSDDAGSAQNTQTGYVHYRQGPVLQYITAWLNQINSYANVQTCTAIENLALDANLNLAMLHCLKCKVLYIDTPNSVTNIKY